MSLSDILFEEHHLRNPHVIESIQNISESFDEIDGGILYFLLKCYREITKIFGKLYEIGLFYND